MIYNNDIAEQQARQAIQALGIRGSRDVDEAMQTGRIAYLLGENVKNAIEADWKALNKDRHFIRDAETSKDYRHERGRIDLEIEEVDGKKEIYEKI